VNPGVGAKLAAGNVAFATAFAVLQNFTDAVT
jgi:hypothetical protein